VRFRTVMSCSKKKLEIFVLCRDRPRYTQEAIGSFKGQLRKNVELIISDNSTNSEVQKLISSEFPEISYRRRLPPIPSANHVKKIIEESNGDYLVMFHDDDRVLPGYIDSLLSVIDEECDVSAIAPNGKFIGEQGNPLNFSNAMVSSGFSGGIRTLNAMDLVNAYYSPKSCGIPPFSGYVYNKKYLIKDLLQTSHGGKHADVSLLVKLSKIKPILWLERVLVESRRHSLNDSAQENLHDRLSLKKYLGNEGLLIRKTDAYNFFRFQYWFFWWLQNLGVKSLLRQDLGWRRKVVRKFILTKCIIYFFHYKKLREACLRRFAASFQRGLS